MDLLQQLVTIFAENGYLAVFIALMICGAGLPLPEDITLVAGGVIAGLGYVNVHAMFALAMFGPSRYAKVQEKFHRYGNRVLFAARFLPGMRTTVYLTAGMTHRVSFVRFLLLDGMAALISVPFWVYLGFFGADNHEWLLTWMHRGQTSLWVLLGIVLLIVLVTWWRHRRRARCAQD